VKKNRDLIFTLGISKIQQSLSLEDIVDVQLSYFNVLTMNPEVITLTGSIQRPSVLTESIVPDMELDKQRNRIFTTEALNTATKLGGERKLAEARKILTEQINNITKSVSGNETFCQALVVDLNKLLVTFKDDVVYKEKGEKYAMNFMMQNAQQRIAKDDYFSSNASYATSSKCKAKKKMEEDMQ